METIAAGRRRIARLGRDERMERMMTEIGSGVAQRRSIAIVDDVDAASWDRLAAQMRAVGDAGGIVAYDIGAHEPIEDDHEQT